jgi:hypothetical protein
MVAQRQIALKNGMSSFVSKNQQIERANGESDQQFECEQKCIYDCFEQNSDRPFEGVGIEGENGRADFISGGDCGSGQAIESKCLLRREMSYESIIPF